MNLEAFVLKWNENNNEINDFSDPFDMATAAQCRLHSHNQNMYETNTHYTQSHSHHANEMKCCEVVGVPDPMTNRQAQTMATL